MYIAVSYIFIKYNKSFNRFVAEEYDISNFNFDILQKELDTILNNIPKSIKNYLIGLNVTATIVKVADEYDIEFYFIDHDNASHTKLFYGDLCEYPMLKMYMFGINIADEYRIDPMEIKSCALKVTYEYYGDFKSFD